MNFMIRMLAGTGSLAMISCAGPSATQPTVPTSFLAKQETIAQSSRQRTVRREGSSGFEMMADGKEAYLARLAVVEAAQKTLDFQYFIWADDVCGTVFADRLLAAADRGVKVRMLLDITHGAQTEVKSAILAAHPNIEIAFFNPMTALKGIFAGNPIPVIGEIDRMQSRMHNKILIADNSLLIGGGRNLGDTYFGVDRKHNMRDLDFIARGPIVTAAAKSYKLYWNSPLTRKGDRTKLTGKDHNKLRALRRSIEHKKLHLAHHHRCPYPVTLARQDALKLLADLSDRMIWAEYEFIADPPERMLRKGKIASPVWRTVEDVIEGSQKDMVMHAAYLIPQEETLALLEETAKRGVKIQLLTNSLASIDGLLAMTGIANRRKEVIQTGAEYYELNARAPARKDYIHSPKITPLGMHTKGLVVDDRISFIGSYNMDPRSKYINTETGVIINSPAFAKRLKKYLMQDLQPENCWHVTQEKNGRLNWSGRTQQGQPVQHHRDPEVPLKKRVSYWLLTHLPWENLL
jgi:putative cardiolipin synthase